MIINTDSDIALCRNPVHVLLSFSKLTERVKDALEEEIIHLATLIRCS